MYESSKETHTADDYYKRMYADLNQFNENLNKKEAQNIELIKKTKNLLSQINNEIMDSITNKEFLSISREQRLKHVTKGNIDSKKVIFQLQHQFHKENHHCLY